MTDKLLKLEEVAQYLRVSERSVKDWAASGELPGGKIGASWRFRQSDIDSWVSKQMGGREEYKVDTSRITLESLVNPARIIQTDATSKAEVLNSLIDEAVSIEGVKDRNELATMVFEREKLMSTGIGLSIAIPHVRLSGVKGVHTVIAVNKNGIDDYDSLDNKPVHFLILFVAGVENQVEYIHSLALFSSILKEPLLREQLQHANSTKEIYSLFIKEA